VVVPPDPRVCAIGREAAFAAHEPRHHLSEVHAPISLAAAYRRVTNGFNCKLWCSARQYDYILPTYCLAPTRELSTRDFRLDEVP
jgi:tRNA U38,U39,U40 pseudouridine synthase TruA